MSDHPQKFAITVYGGAADGMPDRELIGHYICERGTVMLTDFRGRPFVGSGNRTTVTSGENAEAVAKDLLRARYGGGYDSRGDFRSGTAIRVGLRRCEPGRAGLGRVLMLVRGQRQPKQSEMSKTGSQ